MDLSANHMQFARGDIAYKQFSLGAVSATNREVRTNEFDIRITLRC